jgi:16S rRNA (guanine527-N7)-methyltransferase
LAETDGAAAAALAAHEAREELEPLLARSGLPSLPGGFLDRVERFVALLLDANARLNLTRVVEPEPIARLHLLDALAALPVLDAAAPKTAVDLGSGGGMPGIPLALARPDVQWTLVDSVGKKADALRGFVATLGLTNVVVIAERAEILGRSADHRERYDLVAARACAALPVLAELALPLLGIGGALLAWKGPLDEGSDELLRGRDAAAELGGGPLRLIPTGVAALGDHTFVVAPKDGPTPARYPRRPGEPGRRPLS